MEKGAVRTPGRRARRRGRGKASDGRTEHQRGGIHHAAVLESLVRARDVAHGVWRVRCARAYPSSEKKRTTTVGARRRDFPRKKRTKKRRRTHPQLRVPARCAPRWWRGTSAAASRPTTSVPRNPRAGLCRSPSDARRSNATVARRNASRSTPSPRARPLTAVATTTAAAARRARRRATRRTGQN